MRRATVLVIALALGAAVPATASAKLPKPKSTTIVPGTSIGGVSPGMSIKRALKIWGSGSTCTAATVAARCAWVGTGKQGQAYVEVGRDGKVYNVVIESGLKNGAPVFSGPLLNWKTRKKVRLGMTLHAIYLKYPKLVGSGSGGQLGSGVHTTTFSTSGGRVYTIILGPIG
jgi:hypothetical protein